MHGTLDNNGMFDEMNNDQAHRFVGEETPSLNETNDQLNEPNQRRENDGFGAATCSASFPGDVWNSLNQVFDFQNRPTTLGRLNWYAAKTGNPPSVRSLSSFLIYLPEIEMAKDEMGMSLSQLQNHYHQLALALRNHAKSDLMMEVKRQLDKNLHQSLLSISPSSLDMDLYIASLQTSANILRRYANERKVRILFHPTLGYSGMDIYLGEVTPLVSEKAREPFGNMSPLLVGDVRLEFREVSFWQNDQAHRRGEQDTSPEERARKLKEATENVHNDGFGAATCSPPNFRCWNKFFNWLNHWLGRAISPLICRVLSIERDYRLAMTEQEMWLHEERRNDRKWLQSQTTIKEGK